MRPRRIPLKRRLAVLAAATVAATAAGVCAGPALGASYSIELSGPSGATVDAPVLVTASGAAPPPAEYWNAFWIQIVAIPGRVTSTCPDTGQEGLGVATGTGGGIVEIAMHPNQALDGSFSNQTGFTPLLPGPLLVCSYSVDGSGNTFARAALMVDVRNRPAERARSGAPARRHPPHPRRKHRRGG